MRAGVAQKGKYKLYYLRNFVGQKFDRMFRTIKISNKKMGSEVGSAPPERLQSGGGPCQAAMWGRPGRLVPAGRGLAAGPGVEVSEKGAKNWQYSIFFPEYVVLVWTIENLMKWVQMTIYYDDDLIIFMIWWWLYDRNEWSMTLSINKGAGKRKTYDPKKN